MRSQNRRLSWTRRGGFTLIEVMIAMAVMLFGVISLIALQTASVSATGNSYRMTSATGLAQDALERMVRLDFYVDQLLNTVVDPVILPGPGWPAPCLCPGDPQDLPALTDGGLEVNAFGNTNANLGPLMFTRTHFTRFVNPVQPSRLEIFVRVTWSDPNSGKRHGVTISTIRSLNRFSPGP